MQKNYKERITKSNTASYFMILFAFFAYLLSIAFLYIYHGGFPTDIAFIILVLAFFLAAVVLGLPQVRRLIDEDIGKEVKKYEEKHHMGLEGEKKL